MEKPFFVQTALIGAAYLHSVLYCVENVALVGAPEGSEQQFFRTVACQPVDDDVRSEMLQTVDDEIRVGGLCHRLIESLLEERLKVGAAQDMQ